MPSGIVTSTPFWYDVVTIAAGATAKSILTLVTAATSPFVPAGQVVSLNFISDKNLKLGFSTASADETHGGTLTAAIAFADSATGDAGNTIPLEKIFLYAPVAGGTATVTIYIRAIS